MATHLLAEHQHWSCARKNEALVYAISCSERIYRDKMQQIIYNAAVNPLLQTQTGLATMTDAELSKGTVIEDIARENKEQTARFKNMLQEKYELASRSNANTTMRCRRCGSTDIYAEQKQTRGADEAMTVFCTCSRCTLRWTLR